MDNTNAIILPSDMTRINTCCFTGHRVIPQEQSPAVEETVRHAVRLLAACGFRYFVCGGAIGFDMLAERIIAEEAEKDGNIVLVLALPCRDQTGMWLKIGDGTALIREYMRLKAKAEHVIYVNDFYFDGCMKARNTFMVDNSSFCVAYYNGSPKSGSGQTFRMAQKAGLKIYNIADVIRQSDDQ